MAEKRRTASNDARWRENIKAALLLERLENHALGLVNMEPSAVKAAEILLKKCLPDIKIIEMTITDPVKVEVLMVQTAKTAKTAQTVKRANRKPASK